MSIHGLEDLYQKPSYFKPEVLESAREWADEVRPGLKDHGEVADPVIRDSEISPMANLEDRMAPFGILSSRSLAELALIGLKLSRIKEQEGGTNG